MTHVRKLSDIHDQTELGDPRHPVRLRKWHRSILTLPSGSTHFGFSLDGSLSIETPTVQTTLGKGGFFRIHGVASISGRSGFVLSVPGNKGFTQLSGPYSDVALIDYLPGGLQNCLIWPAKVSDPSMNTLHMPPGQTQQSHSHDSLRINLIVGGKGTCVTPTNRFTLSPEDVITIPANEPHSFETSETGLRFIAFHPDSHEEVFGSRQNPMILKTFGLP